MLREKFSIICDDIRAEHGNKFSFMGTYTEGIVVREIPFTFTKLCLAQQFDYDQADFQNVRVILKGPKLKKEVQGHTVGPKRTSMLLMIAFTGIKILQEGEYRFETYFEAESTPKSVRKFSIRLDPDLKIT